MGRRKVADASAVSLRIATERGKKGMRQVDLAEAVSKKMNRAVAFTIPSVSAWETGRKVPSPATLAAIADVLDVSVPYLLGQTNDPHGTADLIQEDHVEETDDAQKVLQIRKYSSEAIDKKNLVLYLKKPVFVTFANGEYSDQWAILLDDRYLTLTDGTRVNMMTYQCTLYPLEIYDFPRYHKRFDKPVGAAAFSDMHVFWVEMITHDDAIRERYNGWYIHSSDRNTIINTANSNILLASGFGTAYRVYTNPFDCSEKRNIHNTATKETDQKDEVE